jgi:sarcosine oxidase subunit alpha
VRLVTNARVAGTRFRGTMRGVDIVLEGGSSVSEFIDCDCIAVSGGLAPAVHLSSQSGARAAYDASIGAFVPGTSKQRQSNAGAMAANFDVAAAIRSGLEAGRQAAEACGLRASDVSDVAKGLNSGDFTKSFCYAPARVTRKQAKKTFVDLQNDVTMTDIMQARLEGYDSPEHMKRYTTLGMATDQGKTSGIPAMHAAAVLQGMTPDERGTTTFRPPYTPVSFGALAGIERGQHYQHLRRTPLQDWHEAHGGRLIETGAWRRPQAYPRRRESLAAAIARETRNVRDAAGICDVSTLGKIEVQGPDAETFLDRIYCTRVSGMTVGRARYGLMLREDGFVLDDGTLARLSPSRFYLTTTTANAERVLRHMEFHAQAIWPELRVRMTSVSDQFGAIAVAGPRSRVLLERVVAGSDLTNAAMPHMSVRQFAIAGEPIRLLRVSYSGELAYEVHVGADHCEAVWQQLLTHGAELGVMPYGLEAMGTLRIEKGHVAGAEIDGRTTPADLGLGALVKADGDFIGRRMLERPALLSPDRMQLVGLVPADDVSRIRGGAVLTEAASAAPPVDQIGHVTSTATSPTLGKPIALGLVRGGLSRWHGRTLLAQSPVRGGTVRVKVVDPVFVDRKGERTRV